MFGFLLVEATSLRGRALDGVTAANLASACKSSGETVSPPMHIRFAAKFDSRLKELLL